MPLLSPPLPVSTRVPLERVISAFLPDASFSVARSPRSAATPLDAAIVAPRTPARGSSRLHVHARARLCGARLTAVRADRVQVQRVHHVHRR